MKYKHQILLVFNNIFYNVNLKGYQLSGYERI